MYSLMKKLFFLIPVFFLTRVYGQIVPDSMLTDWSHAGLRERIYAADTLNIAEINTTESSDDWSEPVRIAIESLQGRAGVIFFPAGEYKLRSQITLPDSVIIRGAGADSTRLVFDLDGASTDCFSIRQTQSQPFFRIFNGHEKGSQVLTVDGFSNFQAGDWVEIIQDNGDWDSNPAPWAENSVGQIIKLTGKEDSAIFLETPLRISFTDTLNPRIRVVEMREMAGIESLEIRRKDSPPIGPLYNIHFAYAANCWVRGVESSRSVGSHILVDASSNIELTGNYIHHAMEYDGVGTRGYGVTLLNHTGEVLVENNIFRHLRHAMMVKQGANGNVFAYNYSTQPFRKEFPNDLTGDISIHGHYAFANLFEGNIVQNIILDHYWGPAGPGNMFFRNRAELYGISLANLNNQSPDTDGQILVGNETTNPNGLMGNLLMGGQGHFLHGNNIKGLIQPANTLALEDLSYYRDEPFQCGKDIVSNPVIGLPSIMGEGENAASQRFAGGENLSVFDCNPENMVSSIFTGKPAPEIQAEIFPNPFYQFVTVKISTKERSQLRLKLTTVDGKRVVEKLSLLPAGDHEIPLKTDSTLPAGVYFVQIVLGEESYTRKLVRL